MPTTRGRASQAVLLCSLHRRRRRRRGRAGAAGVAVGDRRTGSLRRQRGRQDRRLGRHSTGSYLDSHPQTNQALTTITQQQAGPQSLAALKTYFDANPQAGKDMQQLQQPLVDLSDAVQAADHPPAGDRPDAGRAGAGRRAAGHGLPGGLPAAQNRRRARAPRCPRSRPRHRR